MKSRFHPGRLTAWRQRFVAIAWELAADPGRGRTPMGSARPAASPLAPPAGLAGARPGGARTA
ncbi:MAG TPA: hypothetical protein VLT89_07260 [Usitatibacter sp.]|nr:hypothetical protein [Usitatibacter sp.]